MEFDWSDSRSPFRGTYLGHSGLERLWAEMWEAWDEISIDVEDATECGPGRLVTANLVRARGRGSGVATEARGAILWTVTKERCNGPSCSRSAEQALAGC